MRWRRGGRAPIDQRPLVRATLAFTSAQVSLDGHLETVRAEEPAELRGAVLARARTLCAEAGVPMRLILADAHGETGVDLGSARAERPAAVATVPVPATAGRVRRTTPTLLTAGAIAVTLVGAGALLVIRPDPGGAATSLAPEESPTVVVSALERGRLADQVQRRPELRPAQRVVPHVRVTATSDTLTLRIAGAAGAELRVRVTGPLGRLLLEASITVGATARTISLDDLGAGEYRWSVAPTTRGPVRGGTVTVAAPDPDGVTDPAPEVEETPYVTPDPTPYVTPDPATETPSDDGGTGGSGGRDRSGGGDGSLIGGTGPIDPDA